MQMEHYLDFAKDLAQQAGRKMVDAKQSAQFKCRYKQGHELVTSVDLDIDDLLCRAINEAFPNHYILSEESSPNFCFHDISEQDWVWVIDPIDGTVNFAHNHMHVAISIGLIHQEKRVLGVVYAPFLNELFWAEKGQGAYLNEEKLSVSSEIDLKKALVATGFPYVKNELEPLLKQMHNILKNCQDIRRNGSAALDLCWVAAGRLEAYYETVKPWDMAAGALIAAEAGAQIGYYSSKPNMSKNWPHELRSDHLLVAAPDLYQAIYELLIDE
ncbi:inositol monophosphatase [Marinomonas agarivorans]|nr:inositol monophosphatase [Marinomonas agarivorans]